MADQNLPGGITWWQALKNVLADPFGAVEALAAPSDITYGGGFTDPRTALNLGLNSLTGRLSNSQAGAIAAQQGNAAYTLAVKSGADPMAAKRQAENDALAFIKSNEGGTAEQYVSDTISSAADFLDPSSLFSFDWKTVAIVGLLLFVAFLLVKEAI